MLIEEQVFAPLAKSLAELFTGGDWSNLATGFNIFGLPFEGGGFTGNGFRVGGVDGRGGFPAILHPNETVIDHTKSGGNMAPNVTIVQNNDFTNADDNTVAKLQEMMPMIVEATTGQVKQEMAQGGDFYRFASGGR